jgi:hypothetical protein
MIDRTTLELRLADHRSTTARIGASDWQFQRATPHRTAWAGVTTAFVALGVRLAQLAQVAAHTLNRQPGRDTA